MKLSSYVFISLFMILIVGCNTKMVMPKEKINVQISGDSQYHSELQRVYINGESNLEAGTILTLLIEGEEFEREVKVQPRGYFKAMFYRDNSKEGQLIIRLDPRRQTEELMKKYGKHGENLQGTLVEYEVDGETYTTVEAYALLSKVAEEIWDQKGGVQEVLYNACQGKDCK
ncbi:hypothetical protein [Bacillus suaedaesalsae]|uniref:DUF4367 domain-containing protein n=1 Tax=Bacillus suaedaesalsae TaxID=2810349 RepID=A0ABS2DHI1_9BACI|nr:hypothetical protein [Bacillus suaedaesalsae]MBM6617927.1 hypothetical protein [Bacillus suaedaesalsae]